MANNDCLYTLTLVIDMTTDSNNMYIFGLLGVCFFRSAFSLATFLIICNKQNLLKS